MTPHPGFPITARESGGQFVEAFARGLLVIMAFGEGHERMTLSQVAQRAGLTRAGARRLIAEDREQGWSWIQGELEEHICGLSVPVNDHEDRVCAALNISVNSLRMTKEIALRTMLPKLMIAAEQMHRGLELRAG